MMIRGEKSILLESSDVAPSYIQNSSIFNFTDFSSKMQISQSDDHLIIDEKRLKILKNNIYFLDSIGIYLKHT